MLKKLLFAILLLTVSNTLYSDEIVFGMVPDARPTSFIDENGKPAGFFVELFSRIMDELGISYRYEIASFSRLYPKMISGDIQLFAALIKNPEREKLFYFPDTPVISGWGQLFVASDTDYSEINQLNGRKIGIIANDINGRNFKKFASSLGIIYSIKEYLTFSDVLNGVRTGEVYAGVIYNASLAGVEGVKPTSTVFNPLPGYAVTARGSGFEEKLDRIMERVRELKEDKDSYYYKLLNSWMYQSEKINRKLYIIFISVILFFSVAVLIMYSINRYLKAEIFKRTKDLEFSNKIVANSAEGIMITDSSGLILQTNPGFTRITGYSAKEVLGRNPSLLQSGVHDNDFYKELWKSLLEEGYWKGEIVNKRKSGEQYIQSTSIVSIRDKNGQISNFASILADDTMRHIYEEQLQYQANHDMLTGLSSRHHFSERISEEVVSADRNKSCLSMVLIDIDNFRNINDAYGHNQGDKMLKAVAHQLKINLPENSCLARLGGDEFAVISPVKDRNEAEAVLPSEILSLFDRPIEIDSELRIHVSVSLGVAVFPDNTTDPWELYKKADIAINAGKKEGRGRISCYRDDMDLSVQKKIEYENLIRGALKRDEICVFYQPKLDLDRKRISGVEALVRWKLYNDILIPPDEFISIAEETGIIIPIGEFVLKQTCSDIGALSSQLGYKLKAAVNLSGIQFSSELDSMVLKVLEETSFDPEMLELEITESVAVNHLEEVYSVLGKLRESRIRIAMDDFGTGFSSLSYLKDLPLDILKIDKAFTHNIPDLKNDTEVVKLIISMADILELKVVAEGVESKKQLDYLVSQKCREIQGYILSPPLDIEKLKKLSSEFDYEEWLDNAL